MNYIQTVTGSYPITEQEIRRLFPNTSFPTPFLPPADYSLVFNTPTPAYDVVTQHIRETVPEYTDKGVWEQRWEIVELPSEVVEVNVVRKAEADLLAAKSARYSLVAAITVTTQSGKVFDGNEDAQNRMARAVTAMTDVDEVPWVLSDNTVALVGRAEMREALLLAGRAMAEVWVTPYTPTREA